MTVDTPAGKPAYKRRTIVINKPFQYKFIATVMVCVAAAAGVVALDMFSSLGGYLAEGGTPVDFKAVYHDAWLALLVKVAVYFAGVFVVSLTVSHRIAGPMYRFEKSLEEVAKGDLTHKTFIRKGDEWGEFRETVNGMVDALREKLSDDLSKVRAARAVVEALGADAALPAPAREKLRKAAEDLGAVGARFKLS